MDINNGLILQWIFSEAETVTYMYPISFSRKIFNIVCGVTTGTISGAGPNYTWVTAIVGGVNRDKLELSQFETLASYPSRNYLIIGI